MQRHVILGAVAGVATAVGFAALHELVISDIWFSVVPMSIAGALCGASLVWTYMVLFAEPTTRTWISYVTLQAAILVALGLVSVAAFEPVVPMAVLIAANEPPTELIVQAMPLTAAFTLVAAALISVLWGRSPTKFVSALVSSTVLVIFLGLNVSVLGLVETAAGSVYMIAEFFGLLIAILAGFGVAFFALSHRTLFGAGATATDSESPVPG